MNSAHGRDAVDTPQPRDQLTTATTRRDREALLPSSRGGRHPHSSQQAITGGLWIATSRFVPLVGTAVLSISIARILGADALGLQNYVAFVDAMLAIAVQWVIVTVSIRVLSAARAGGDDEQCAGLARGAFVFNAGAGAVSATILLLIGSTGSTPWPWTFAAFAALFNGIAWGYAVQVIAAFGWAPIARRRLLTQFVAVLGGLLAVMLGAGIPGVFAAVAVASATFLVLVRLVHGPLARGRLGPVPPLLWRLWLQLLGVELLLQIVMQKSGVLFLEHWADQTEIAMFSVAFMVVASSAALPIALVVSGLPSVAAALGSGTIESTLRRLRHPVRVMLLGALPLTAFVASTGPAAVLALYGPQFRLAATYVPMLALSLLFSSAAMICVTFWIGADRIKVPLVAAAAGAAANIAASIALIPSLHGWGAVWASVVGQLILAVVVLGWTARYAEDLKFPARRWLAGTGVAGVIAVGMHVLQQMIGSQTGARSWAALGVVALGSMLLLWGYGRFVGFLDPQDCPWLAQSLPARLQFVGRALAGRDWPGPQVEEGGGAAFPDSPERSAAKSGSRGGTTSPHITATTGGHDD